MSKVNYTGFISGSLCKSVRYSRVPVVTSRKDDKPVCAGLFEFVMSHYAVRWLGCVRVCEGVVIDVI